MVEDSCAEAAGRRVARHLAVVASERAAVRDSCSASEGATGRRVVVSTLFGPRALACSSGTAAELGGTVGSGQTLRFVPPNTLTGLPFRTILDPSRLDPATALREAISAGTAHDEGRTQLGGRTLERIRIDPSSDCPFPPCPREPGYAYVDPETFYPVQTESPQGFIAQSGGPVVRLHVVERIVTYEYLPRTPANLALTDIQAQHPNATGR